MRDLFLAIGEAMIEMAPTDAGTYAMGFAGDTLNTAWYARRLLPADWRVGYLSAVGQDAISARMLRFIEDAGVETAAVARLPDRTVGLYLIEVTHGERRFAYWRSDSAARALAAEAGALDRALAPARVAYFSGITLAILPPEDRARLLSALARARAAGAVIAFDPNIRPRLWSDPETMRAGVSAGAAVADIVLPSFEDEAALFHDADPAATAARYAGAGAGLVVVKDGPGDVVCCANGALSRHPVEPAAAVVDTTAAGDSFNAGFLARHMAGDDLAGAVRAGARLAGRVIGRRGALAAVDLADDAG